MSEGKDTRRLQAYLAMCGIGSRRACERIIQEGRVTINGTVATVGQSASPGDRIALDGKLVTPQKSLRYIVLNKPPGFVSTMFDEMDRPTAAGLLKGKINERVYNVGRLDQWSCGLLLFTNDGELARRLTHPSGNTEKEYEVVTDLPIPQGFESDFSKGVRINDIIYTAKSVRVTDPTHLNIVLTEGKNREVRRVLEYFGLRALVLRRIRFGPVLLGKLAEGEWRELSKEEVDLLLERDSRRPV